AARCVSIGFPIFTVALVTGAIVVARMGLVQKGVMRPEYVAAIASWVAFGVLLVARVGGWQGRRAAWLTVSGFAGVLLVVLGQIKDAFGLAMKANTAGRVLGSAFQSAFRAARKVRRDTAIARQPVSVSSVAVELARQVWSGFEGRRVLVVGAGKMSDLATRALRASGAAVSVTNRTAARAEELARRLGCDVEPFTDLEGARGRA